MYQIRDIIVLLLTAWLPAWGRLVLQAATACDTFFAQTLAMTCISWECSCRSAEHTADTMTLFSGSKPYAHLSTIIKVLLSTEAILNIKEIIGNNWYNRQEYLKLVYILFV